MQTSNNPALKITDGCMLIGGSAAAMVQWSEIGFRLSLFYREYGAKLHRNHFGDGGFALIYFANFILLLVAICCWRRVRKATLRLRLLAALSGALNLAGWLAFIYMHNAGILVEYGEFIRDLKKGG